MHSPRSLMASFTGAIGASSRLPSRPKGFVHGSRCRCGSTSSPGSTTCTRRAIGWSTATRSPMPRRTQPSASSPRCAAARASGLPAEPRADESADGDRPERAATLALGPTGLGRLRHGNRAGDYRLAPRCGAKTRAGHTCRQPAMANGRCRLHGGKSIGPRSSRRRSSPCPTLQSTAPSTAPPSRRCGVMGGHDKIIDQGPHVQRRDPSSTAGQRPVWRPRTTRPCLG